MSPKVGEVVVPKFNNKELNMKGSRVGRFFNPEDFKRPDVIASLDALADITKKELLRACYAETVAPLWVKRYASGHKYRPVFRPYTGGHFCINALLQGRARTNYCDKHGCLRPPGDDHGELWIDEARVPQRYVFHPYGLLSSTIAELVAFCEQHALDFQIDTTSWYYPTETLFVELKKRS